MKFSFVTTLDYSDFPEYSERAVILPLHDGSILGQLSYAFRIVRAARTCKALLLDSASGTIHPDLLASILIGFWRKSRRPVIVMMGDMWHRDTGLQGWVQKVLLCFGNRGIFRYAPLSREEFPVFSKTWRISDTKLRFLHYFYTFTKEDLNSPPPAPEDFIFSGGNSHRDYGALLRAIEKLPEYNFVIASHRLDGMQLPPNVQAGQVPRDEFIRLMRAAKMVIVPIQRGLTRSTGHQTYLNGMLLGKPTIVTETLGVKDHVVHNETAIIVDGSPDSYQEAIRWVLDPANKDAVQKICKQGQDSVVKDFSFEKHCQRLLDILDEAYEDYYHNSF
jgi:glycosyltransferase involved in cell wall biosynthesis